MLDIFPHSLSTILCNVKICRRYWAFIPLTCPSGSTVKFKFAVMRDCPHPLGTLRLSCQIYSYFLQSIKSWNNMRGNTHTPNEITHFLIKQKTILWNSVVRHVCCKSYAKINLIPEYMLIILWKTLLLNIVKYKFSSFKTAHLNQFCRWSSESY